MIEAINKIENLLTPVFKNKNLTELSFTKFRWDQPDFSISWGGSDSIQRSIQFAAFANLVSVTVTARSDDEDNLKRRWTSENIATLIVDGISGNPQVLLDTAEAAYNKLIAITSADLISVSDLSPSH